MDKLSDYMHSVEVKGPLSYFYPLNVDITEDVAKSIVGLPIKNCNSDVNITIGKIERINWETGEWFGYIVVDGSIMEHICEGYRQSMSFTRKEIGDGLRLDYQLMSKKERGKEK